VIDRGLGYLTDVPSPDDVRLGVQRPSLLLGAADLPEADLHMVELAPPTKDQLIYEACVGFSIMNLAYVMQAVAGMEPVLPSPGFIWWNSLKSHGDEGRNQGTYFRNCIRTLTDLGIAPESLCRIADLDKRLRQPGSDYDGRPDHVAYQHAYDSKFEIDPIRLDADDGDEAVRQVKSCVVNDMPVAFGMLVPRSFQQLAWHDTVDLWEPGSPMAGGHAMCAVGYDSRGVIVQNSWGEFWGNRGKCRLSWDFFRSGWVDDKWACRKMPQIG
jgi:hypothetical protein